MHPIHVEAVAGVIGRAELMCALGFVAALILLLHRPLTVRRALAIVACTLLAVLSKEQGLLLPPMLLAVGFVVHRRPAGPRQTFALKLLVILISFSMSGYIIFRESILKFWWDRVFLDWTINPLVRSSGIDRLLMPIVLLGHYVALLVAPLRLSIDYGAEVIGSKVKLDDPYLYIGLMAIVAGAIAAAHALWTRSRALLICLFGFVLTYGMISNALTLIGTNFGERLMYLPSVFFLAYLALLMAPRVPARALAPLLGLLVIAGAARSIEYARRWNDRLSFYQWEVASQPRSIRLRMLLVAELMSQKRLEEAAAAAAAAREMLGEYDEVWIQSADVAAARGDAGSAERFLNTAMSIRPSNKAAGRLQAIRQRSSTSAPASAP